MVTLTIHYIKSLHRPYNSRLKTVKWVCEFAKQSNDIIVEDFKYSFYIFIVNKLYEYYESSNAPEVLGVPSRDAIRTVYTMFNDLSLQDKTAIVQNAMKKKSRDKDDFDKIVFSTYKAASYFITLAQKHFKLLDRKNMLTEEGMVLASLKNTDFITLSSSESDFFLSIIAKKDLVLFLMQISFNRYKNKKLDNWNSEEYIDMLIQFINGFPELNLLKYNRRSLANYSVVRSKWIEELKVLKPDGKLTSKAANVIKSTSPEIFDLYEDYYRKFNRFEIEKIKPFNEYRKLRKDFIKYYKLITSKSTIDGFDYVNLYDIKGRMKLSHEKMQRFLEKLSSDRNRKHNIYFQNIVKSIDGRKRFTINDTPVITVRIDGV